MINGKRSMLKPVYLVLLVVFASSSKAGLDDACVVNILNRTIQVSANGGWSLPNVPSNQGLIRARATCIAEDGSTISGQSDYFSVNTNGISQVPPIIFEGRDPIPSRLSFSSTQAEVINAAGNTSQLTLTAHFADGTQENVTDSGNGVNYATTNAGVATVSADGLVTAVGNGFALISARKDGVIAARRVIVNSSGDLDGDGLPDDYETENRLNPNDPVDALEDQDGDGLSALDEYNVGTNLNIADTDGDGISDGEEINPGDDGYVSDPLLVDTDGDGLSDLLEVSLNSDPGDANDHNYDAAVVSYSIEPPAFSLINNTIQPDEIGQQISLTGVLLDGSTIDLTSTVRGTNYASSDLAVCNFGLTDGLVFGSSNGSCDITVSNGAFSQVLSVTVSSFDPAPLSVVSIPGYANNVDVEGDTAYIAAGSSGLQVVHLGAERTSPSVISSLDTNGTSIDIKVRENYAYIADGSAGLKVIDVTDSATPVLVGSVDTPSNAQDLQIQNGLAYIADGDGGLQVADVSNPASPVIVGHVSGIGIAKGVDVFGNVVVVGSTSGLYVIDVSAANFPVVVGSVSINDIKDVILEGSYAYVAAYSTGYFVVDISDASAPTIVSQGSEFVSRDVATSGDLALYAEQLFPNAITYVNIRQPENSVFQGTIDMSGLGDYAGTGIALDQQFAYITAENYVVSSDYGSSGNTVLMVAQYRQLEDNEGIAPSVSLIEPDNGDTFIQGETVTIAAEASDDIFVSKVQLLVNGEVVTTDGGEPYEFRYTLATDMTGSIDITARAVDLGNNSSTTPSVTVNVIEDPKTTVVGTVVTSEGVPVQGATVTCAGFESLTDTEGLFTVENVPSISDFNCSATALVETNFFSGMSSVITPVRGGETNLGEIIVQNSFFDDEYGANLYQGDDDYDYVSFVDGFTFPFFGSTYTGVYVGSNGRLMFEYGDRTYTESFSVFTSQPNIAAFFDDLHPGRSPGSVHYKQEGDRFVVTWANVQQFSFGGSNTIQMIMFTDGRISFAYNGVSARGAFIGLSTGESLGATELDLSSAPYFVDQPVSVYELFKIGDGEFDLDRNFILFTPQGEGFDIGVAPLQ